jgi:hydrogenase/urease accessory protein HupE
MRLPLPSLLLRAAALFVLSLAVVARAHQPGLSTVLIDLGSNQLTAQLIFAWQELDGLVSMDTNQDRALSQEEFAAAKPKLLRTAESALELLSDGRMLALKKLPEARIDDTTGIRLDLVYEFPSTRVLTITAELIAELPPAHRQILTVRDPGPRELHSTVLERAQPTVDLPLFALRDRQPERGTAIRQFLWLGVEHIATGWDHLAFLFGLLLVGGTLREAVKIITSFTIAHSLTLVLATLNVIYIPSRIVEPIIAASIVYVGFENILRDNFSKRWMLTFAFGLIHGCGFASILREMGIGADGRSVVTPLVCFNLGVELGQLALAGADLEIETGLPQTLGAGGLSRPHHHRELLSRAALVGLSFLKAVSRPRR